MNTLIARRQADSTNIGLPKWIWVVVIGPLIVAAIIAVSAWAWNQTSATTTLEVRVEQHERILQHMDGKLDRILEHMTK